MSERLVPPTPRQLEVWRLKMNGYSWNRIAALLGVSRSTVKEHFRRADEKLNEKEAA